jgi:Xaa-Pro aminopeptidase
VKSVRWLSQFEQMFQTLMTRCDGVFLNSNEHPRADLTVETRDARFIASCQRRFPLHRYHRLAPLMAQLRAVKSAAEVDLIRKAVDITDEGLRRVYRFVKPGVKEYEVEAELAHTFISRGGRFAYNPIIAGGANSCVLHYIENDKALRSGDVLLLDVAAAYGNYNSDLTRTIPVNGKFTKRQRSVYEAVLAVLRGSIAGATVGKPHRDWHHESQVMMNQELLKLGLLKPADVRKHTREAPACRKYYMHGLGHSLGLGVHDLGDNGPAFRAGMVLTVEPGVYLPDEGFGVRLENDILLTENGPIDLCAHVPIEAREVEALMRR